MTPPTTADQPKSYSSPLPTPRPHLGHAMASEWTKLVSVRSTMWTLGSLVLTVVGVGLLFVVQTGDPRTTRASPSPRPLSSAC